MMTFQIPLPGCLDRTTLVVGSVSSLLSCLEQIAYKLLCSSRGRLLFIPGLTVIVYVCSDGLHTFYPFHKSRKACLNNALMTRIPVVSKRTHDITSIESTKYSLCFGAKAKYKNRQIGS